MTFDDWKLASPPHCDDGPEDFEIAAFYEVAPYAVTDRMRQNFAEDRDEAARIEAAERRAGL